MTHKEFMKQSLCRFQFTPCEVGSYAIDTNFNFYFIHGSSKTSISLTIGASLKNVATLNHVLPIMTFDSYVLNKTVTLIYDGNINCIKKLRNLDKALK